MKNIADIATEIGVSKQAIHQKIKRKPLSESLRQFTSTDGNAIMVDENGEQLIKSAFSKVKPTTISTKDKLIDSLQKQVDSLTAELQIEREHSREQSDKIAELAEKFAQLTENGQVLLREQNLKSLPPAKISLWDKLFKKNERQN